MICLRPLHWYEAAAAEAAWAAPNEFSPFSSGGVLMNSVCLTALFVCLLSCEVFGQSATTKATAIYALSRAGVVSRSTDSATTWQQVPIPGVDPGMYTAAIALDPRNPSNMYVYFAGSSAPGGGRLRGPAPRAGLVHALFHSTDGGQSWSQADLPDNISIMRLVVDSASSNVLYAVTNLALYRSTDSGLTFSDAGAGLAIT